MGYHPEAGVRRHHRHRHQITQHQEGLACQLKGDWNLLGRLPHHANRDRWVVPPPPPQQPSSSFTSLSMFESHIDIRFWVLGTLGGLESCCQF